MRQVLVSIAVLFIFSGVAFAGAPALEVRALNGDVNSDGAVDLADVISIRDHVLGVTSLAAPRLADLDRDGEVTFADAQDLLASVDPDGTKFAVRVHIESDPGGFSQIVEQEDLLREVLDTETDAHLERYFDKAFQTLDSTFFTYSTSPSQVSGCVDCTDPTCSVSFQRTVEAWLIFNGDADDRVCGTGSWNAINVTTSGNATEGDVTKSQESTPATTGEFIKIEYDVNLNSCSNFAIRFDIAGQYSDDPLDTCP